MNTEKAVGRCLPKLTWDDEAIPLSCFEMGPSTSNQTIDHVFFQ